ncbi:MAG: DUF4396 domain-containing protein [Myxococcota bacterium]
MLDGVLILWFVLTAGSLAFVVVDAVTNTPVSWVQKLAWVLVVFYTGPVGLFVYLLACRSPGPGMHDAFTKAHWKQSVNSEMHCLAGDATGIVLAAIVVSFFELPNGWDVTIEYLAAFAVGLLVFQALMMRSMYDGNYGLAVRKTFFAETVSMNMVMVGMIPAMVILMHYIPEARKPTEPAFWWAMGMAAIAGGLTAYPINSWMVRKHLKHGCMTLPEPGTDPSEASHGSAMTQAQGVATAAVAAVDGPPADSSEPTPHMDRGDHRAETGRTETGMRHAATGGMAMGGMAMGGMAMGGMEMGDQDAAMGGMEMGGMAMGGMEMGGMEMGGMEMGDQDAAMGGMEMGELDRGVATAMVLATFALMLIAAWATSTWVAPIRFS